MGTDDVTIAEVARSLVRIEVKLDRSLERIEQKVDKSFETLKQDTEKELALQEARLARLERAFWSLLGLSGGSASVSIWSFFS